MFSPLHRNALLQYLVQQQPQNMLVAAAEDGFDPNGPIAQMLRAQRAAEAAKAAQAQKAPPPKPKPYDSATEVLRQRMRQAGVE